MTKARQFSFSIALILALGSCSKSKTDLGLRFQLLYDGAPMVMLQDYRYPDGKMIQFTRVSFFLSDLMIKGGDDEILIKEVDFVNPTSAHGDLESAEDGFSYFADELAISQIDQLTFNIGLTTDQNKTVPADHPSGSPLARPGEYWVAWDSYIFAKIEGWIDLDGDGQVETGMALHMGSDKVFRTASFDLETTGQDIKIELDLYHVFKRDQIYDIEANPQLHSLSQLPAAEELAENMAQALKIK